MSRGRPVPPIDLSPDGKTQLQSIARSRSLPHGLVRRAQMILMAAEGFNNKTRVLTRTGSLNYSKYLSRHEK